MKSLARLKRESFINFLNIAASDRLLLLKLEAAFLKV